MKKIFILIASFYCISANAIVVRHDVDSEKYSTNETEYPAVFPLFDDGSIKECVATLIDVEWAITAAHCTILIPNQDLSTGSFEVKIAGVKNSIAEVFVHEKYGKIKPIRNESGQLIDIQGIEDQTYDVALLKLGTAADHVKPLPFYKKTDEIGKEIIIMGWGDFGKGDSGTVANQPINDRVFRVAQNRINEVDGNFLIFSFDSPNSKKVLPLEGVAGPGDSGGPAFIKNGEQLEIIGISSAGDYPSDLGVDYQNAGRYGWIEFYVRTSQVKDWIDDVLGQDG